MKQLYPLLLFSICWIVPTKSNAQTPPNVIFILCDDLNDAGGDIGGHPQAITPNIDALQAEGVTFTNAACNAPVCGPSRASLWSGLYPHTTGFHGYEHNSFDWENNPTIAAGDQMFEHMKANNYNVYGCGKLFHNGDEDYTQFTQPYGPEASFGPYPWDGTSYEPYGGGTIRQRKGHPDMPGDLSNGWASGFFPLSQVPTMGTYTGWIDDNVDFTYVDDNNRGQMPDEKNTDYAASILNMSHSEPFFMAVGYNRPHTPHYAPTEFFDMYPLDQIQLADYNPNDLDDVATTLINNGHLSGTGKYKFNLLTEYGTDSTDTEYWFKRWTQGYLACVSFVDSEIGRLLDSLDASPYANNTIVILTSDHGYHMREKDYIFKYTLWEESARVPMVVRGPSLPQGQMCTKPVSLVDVYPTLLDVTGVPDPTQALDGHSFWPLVEDPTNGTWTGPDVALTTISSEDDIAIDEPADPQRQHYSVRSDRYRYTVTSAGEEELYDHDIDPNEWTNLASDPSYASIKAGLKAELLALTGTQDPVTGIPFTLFNGDFEFGLNGWNRNAGDGAVGTYYKEEVDVQQGTYALRFDLTTLGGNPWSTQAVNTNLKLIQDTTYEVSFWAKSTVAGGLFKCDVTKNSAPWSTYGTQSVTTTDTWTKYEFSFTSPVTENIDNRILFQFQSTGDFYIDDVQINMSSNEVVAETVICNMGFETDYVDWNMWTNDGGVGSWLIETSDVHGGAKAARFEYTTLGANAWSTQLVSCNTDQVQGHEYEVKFWAKALSTPQNLKLSAGKASATWTEEANQTYALTTDWTEYTLTYTAANSWSADYRIKFQFEELGTYLIDDVSITDKTVINSTSSEIASGLRMFPNPASDQLFIEVDGLNLILDNYKIVSLSGATVQAGALTGGAIDIAELNAGMYYVVVGTDKGNTALRFMKN